MMKKAVVFISNNDYMAMEEAMNRYQDGFEVFFVVCDKNVGVCHANYYGSKVYCKFCIYSMMKHITPLLKKDRERFHCVKMSELVTKKDVNTALKETFVYSTVDELKNIEYHDVEIGYGAFSTYVSCSRNVMPNFTNELCNYLNMMMRAQIRMTLALERYLDNITPDLIVFHNGRFLNFKPWLCLAKKKCVDFVATETRRSTDDTMMKNNFFNEIPHSQEAFKIKTEKAWEKCGAVKGSEIGRQFFENRRKAKAAGDKVYTKRQEQGKLPEDFDYSKRNIAIFNSSEDEYFSISKEYDNAVLFPNQYTALKNIFEHYKDCEDLHFFLRIHPNLAKVPFKSHLMLYELKYDNVTIIPPQSPVSSYTLMGAVEKVIVFNSTMGLESSYWGKPVIALNRCFYSEYNIVHEPKTVSELYEMIDDKDLKCLKDEEACYKLACFCMGYGVEDFKYYKNKLYDWHGFVYPWSKILGSSKLYRFVEYILKRAICKYGGTKEYKLYIKNRTEIDKI